MFVSKLLCFNCNLFVLLIELEKMNIKLKEGNKKLNEELKVSEENLPDQNEKKRFSDCQKLINEMQYVKI